MYVCLSQNYREKLLHRLVLSNTDYSMRFQKIPKNTILTIKQFFIGPRGSHMKNFKEQTQIRMHNY